MFRVAKPAKTSPKRNPSKLQNCQHAKARASTNSVEWERWTLFQGSRSCLHHKWHKKVEIFPRTRSSFTACFIYALRWSDNYSIVSFPRFSSQRKNGKIFHSAVTVRPSFLRALPSPQGKGNNFIPSRAPRSRKKSLVLQLKHDTTKGSDRRKNYNLFNLNIPKRMFSFESDVCAIEDDNLWRAFWGKPKVTRDEEEEEEEGEMATRLCLINKRLEIEMIKRDRNEVLLDGD